MFEAKDFERLHMYKIKNELSVDDITSQYFFCIDNRMLFIKKSRRFFKIMASCQCGFEPIWRESCLDVLYYNTDLQEVIKMFYGYIFRLVKVVDELH